VPEEHPLDAFDALLAEAEADPKQAEMLAAGRQWVAQAFYKDEHRTLAGLRLAAGLSQRQLGERCGIGQQHISRYESGKHKPSLDTAHQMARALGVDLDTYFNAWQATVATTTHAPKP
jgi:DNA-binding XRE family transcriptional regulator